MTRPLFLRDCYLKMASACVLGFTESGGIILDTPLFYATSGGQPADHGVLRHDGQVISIVDCRKGEAGTLILVPERSDHGLTKGTEVEQEINFERRYRHMRLHTALHLLSVVVPCPVTGGSISEVKARLDFDMPDPPEDKELITQRLNDLIARDFEVTEQQISEEQLDARPDLVKTLKVQPPRGRGTIRLIRIGDQETQVDLQPCGGTHVKRLSEIGFIKVSKFEKKGRQNRRIHIVFEE